MHAHLHLRRQVHDTADGPVDLARHVSTVVLLGVLQGRNSGTQRVHQCNPICAHTRDNRQAYRQQSVGAGQQCSCCTRLTCRNVTMLSRPLICANTCLHDTILQPPTQHVHQAHA